MIKKMAVTGSLLLLVGGCASVYRDLHVYETLSSGHVGCTPEDIRISNVRSNVVGLLHTWVAICGGRHFQCSGQAGNTSCHRIAAGRGAVHSKYGKGRGRARGTVIRYYPPAIVRAAQQSLNNQGYDAGRVDGLFGRRTQKALKTYQGNRALQQTGTLDENTLSALDITREVASEPETPRRNDPEAQEPMPPPTATPTPTGTLIVLEDTEPPTAAPTGTLIMLEDTEPPTATPTGTLIVLEDTELKASPDPFSSTLDTVKTGQALNLLSKSGGWFNVETGGKQGYVFSEFMKASR